jgi:Aldehyde dehydrogenase family
VNNSSEVAQEELFGPVSIVLPYGDVDEAITMANDSAYGLSQQPRADRPAMPWRWQVGCGGHDS